MENSNQILNTELDNIEINNTSTDVKCDKINQTSVNSEITEINMNEEKNSPEFSNEETSSESIDIKTEDANTTNCLALTIQKEHKLVAVKNVFIRSVRMSWKVVVSSITLAIIKLLS